MQAVRRALHVRRAGHAGTLDPFATGLLTVLVGTATRLSRYLTGLPKEYTGTLRLGAETETDDLTGRIVSETSSGTAGVSDTALAAAMVDMVGKGLQLPPAYSAKKVGGVAAHRRVRRGEQVALSPVEVEVYRFALKSRDGPDVSFDASVASGTYIRSLARDLGRALGCGAHLRTLRRQQVGPFHVRDAVSPVEISEERVLPVERAVLHLPRVDVDVREAADVTHGRAIGRPGAVPPEGPVAIFHEHQLCAVGEAGECTIQPRVVLVS